MAEIKTTALTRGWLWKLGKMTGWWVRRFYILLRRAQIDEMTDSATNVVHELCCFQNDADFSECLSSIILEEVIKFEHGAEAGLPDHIKLKLAAERAAGRRGQQHKKAAGKAKKKTMFDGLYNALATRIDTDDLKDYTLLLTLKDRQVRLRPETKSAFDTWSSLMNQLVPHVRTQPMFEGWVWRRMGSDDWRQRYAILYEGVLFYFATAEESEKFKLVAARTEDAMFIATPLAEAIISVEQANLSASPPLDDRIFVLNFRSEDEDIQLDEYISVVDEAQMNAWMLAVRNARHWFESIADDHPTRRLFGGQGANKQDADDDGPMLASNVNPLASRENLEKIAIRRDLFKKMAKAGALVDAETLEDLFVSADLDGSGELSMSELRKLMQKRLNLAVDDKEWKILIESLDQNDDGYVSLSEFRTWYFSNISAVPQPKADPTADGQTADGQSVDQYGQPVAAGHH